MLMRLMQHVVASTDDDILSLSVEDIAVASAWYDSLEKNAKERESLSAIPLTVQEWKNRIKPVEKETEGRRQQPLLRKILSDARLDGVDRLHRNELDVLAAAHTILADIEETRRFTRLFNMLEALSELVHQRRNALEPAPKLVALEDMIHYVTARDIQQARSRSVSAFAGIDITVRGPVYTQRGDVKVLDSVPDDTMLVVENGTCYVAGYVLGRIAASHHCEVAENIAGMVVVAKNDIRARNLINTAYVAAKAGNVYARGAEYPSLVYAGVGIVIRGKTFGGSFAAQTIQLEDETSDGIYHVSRALQGTNFIHTGNREMRIILRTRVSSEDFGGLVTEDAHRQLMSVARNRRKRQTIHDIIELTLRECEKYAENAIVYLKGGEHLRSLLEDINATRRRLGFLDRIIAGIEAITLTAEEELDGVSIRNLSISRPEEGTITTISNELSAVESEGPADTQMTKRRHELLRASEKLDSSERRGPLPAADIKKFREKKVQWILEREELIARIRHKETALEAASKKHALPASPEAMKSNVVAFAEMVSVARRQGPADPLLRRSQSSFIKLMTRSIESRKRRVDGYRIQLESLRETHQELCAKLENEHSVRVAETPDANRAPTYAEGQFGEGVIICTERALSDEDPEPGHSVVTSNSLNGPIRFIRGEEGIVEEVAKAC